MFEEASISFDDALTIFDRRAKLRYAKKKI
jgi:hypothetical protein